MPGYWRFELELTAGTLALFVNGRAQVPLQNVGGGVVPLVEIEKVRHPRECGRNRINNSQEVLRALALHDGRVELHDTFRMFGHHQRASLAAVEAQPTETEACEETKKSKAKKPKNKKAKTKEKASLDIKSSSDGDDGGDTMREGSHRRRRSSSNSGSADREGSAQRQVPLRAAVTYISSMEEVDCGRFVGSEGLSRVVVSSNAASSASRDAADVAAVVAISGGNATTTATPQQPQQQQPPPPPAATAVGLRRLR